MPDQRLGTCTEKLIQRDDADLESVGIKVRKRKLAFERLDAGRIVLEIKFFRHLLKLLQ